MSRALQWEHPGRSLPAGRVTVPHLVARRPLAGLAERIARVVILLSLFLERVAVPGTSGRLPLLVPTVTALLLLALIRGIVELDTRRLGLYFAALGLASASALIDVFAGRSFSLLSFVYLIVLYFPAVLFLGGGQPGAFQRLAGTYLSGARILALLALLQLGLQLVGWQYQDLLTKIIPQSDVVTGYATTYPLLYGTGIYRSNAFLCLEPSFLSRFLALAVLLHVVLRRPSRALVLYLAAMATTLSGTGPLMLAAGIIVLAVTQRRSGLLRFGVVGAVVSLGVAASPLGSLFAQRLNESSTSSTSSASLRFTLPYQDVLAYWVHSGLSTFFGYGPGSAQRYVDAVLPGLLAPVIPKMLFEYGFLAGIAFLVFAAYSFAAGTPSAPVTAAILVAYFFLGSSLLSPPEVYIWICLTSLVAVRRESSAHLHDKSTLGEEAHTQTALRGIG